ncbi:MAG: hypothetical protein R6U28_07645 [Cyclonatronaceae bacterium]
MSYHDQPYYKEFRDLLTRIQSAVAELKTENKRLSEENREFSQELTGVRRKLSEAQNEVERLNDELESASKPASKSSVHPADDSLEDKDRSPGASRAADLFDGFDDNEKRILRQQILDLIQRIDRHLDSAGTP